jgi:hypothetical protein
MYSVIFTAIDRAGNEKSARTLFFYDDSSHVQLVKDKTIQVKESTKVKVNITEYIPGDDTLNTA